MIHFMCLSFAVWPRKTYAFVTFFSDAREFPAVEVIAATP